YLGISVGDSAAGAGARVDTVRFGSPASKAGLRSGDVIVAANGTKVASANQLTSVVAEQEPGDTLRLTVERGGSTLTIDATLGTRPATPSAHTLRALRGGWGARRPPPACRCATREAALAKRALLEDCRSEGHDASSVFDSRVRISSRRFRSADSACRGE